MENEVNQLKDKLIFGKYKIVELISKGSFGKIYLAKNIETKKLYAVKAESRYCENPLLETEAYTLYNLKGLGIPSVISYGYFGKYNVLVQTLLGKSLNRIWLENNKKLNLKDICMIAIQTLDRIEFVHSKYYIHRDIKPANFLVGYPDSSLIYLIDFANARKYRSSRTGKHIKNNKTKKYLELHYFYQ
jgi:casein kinase 1